MNIQFRSRIFRKMHLKGVSENTLVLLFLLVMAVVGIAVAGFPIPVVVVGAAFVPLAVLALIRTVNYPSLMPVAILFTAIFLPLYLPTGTMSVIVDSMLLSAFTLGIWLFKYVVTKDGMSFEWDRETKWLVAFMVVVPISFLWSNLLRDQAVIVRNSFIFVQAATSVVMILLPGTFIITANQVKTENVIKVLFSLLLIGGGIGIFTDRYMGGEIISTGGLFTAWTVIAAVGMVIFHKKMPLFIKFLLIILSGAWIYYRFVTNTSWLAGWLPTFVGIGFLALLKSKKLALALLIVLILFVALNIPYFNRLLAEEQDVSGNTRVAAWALNLQLASKHFLFGMGPGGYIAYYWEYYPSEAMATHNNYFDILSELGIMGFVPFLLFFIFLTYRGFKLVRKLKGRNDFLESAANIVLAGTVASIVAMAFGDWVIPFPYTQSINSFDYEVISWVFMGLIIAIDRMTPSPTPS